MAFPSLTLTGSPYQRGWRYGSQAAAQVRHSIASYALLFAHDCGFDWAAAQARAQPYVPV